MDIYDMQIRSQKKAILIDVFFVVLCILSTDVISFPISTNVISLLLLAICFFSFICFVIYNKELNISDHIIIIAYLIIPCISILFSQIWNFDKSFGFEYKITLLLLGFIIASVVDYYVFKKIYVSFMILISIVSLVVFLSIQIDFNWWSGLPLSTNGEFYLFGVGVVPISSYFRTRNFGPFWEPGVFQAYLNIALLFLLFSEEKKRLWKIIIVVVTILTTLSTTGYICMMLLFFIWYMRSGYKNVAVLAVSLVALSGLVIVFLQSQFFERVFGKFTNGSISFSIRLMDIKIYFFQWLNNPVFGLGVSKSIEAAHKTYAGLTDLYSYSGTSFSGSVSTTMREFSCFGGLLGFIRILTEWKYSKYISKTILESVLLFIFFMILLNTEDFIYSLMFNTLFFYGVVRGKYNDKSICYFSYYSK